MATYSAWGTTAPPVNSSVSGSNVHGTEFTVSAACAVTTYRIYRYSTTEPSTSTTHQAAIYQVSTGTALANSTRSLGTVATGTGWKAFTLPTAVPLTAGVRYKLVVLSTAMPYIGGYWSNTAPNGRTSGIITVQGTTAATGGIQGTLAAGATALTYPTANSGSGGRLWGIDLIVDDTLGGSSGGGGSSSTARPGAFMPFFGV